MPPESTTTRGYLAPPLSPAGYGRAAQLFVLAAAGLDAGLISALRAEDSEATAGAHRTVQHLTGLWYATYVPAAIFTILLLYRAHQNVFAWGGGDRQRRGRGWTLGGWICPILNLWVPLQVVTDLVAESEARPAAKRLDPMVTLWWLLYLGASGALAQARLFDEDELYLVGHAFAAAAGVVFVIVVERLIRAQQRRIREFRVARVAG